MTRKDLGGYIRFWRKKKGLTQLELAKKLQPKTTKEQISKIETGVANFRINYLFQIADALGCDISSFCPSMDGKRSENIILFQGTIEELEKRLLQKNI